MPVKARMTSTMATPKQAIEKEDLPKLINFLEQQEERGNYFSKAMK